MEHWNRHIALIETYCDLKWANSVAVWYFDGDDGVCEFRAGACFPCDSFAEFEELCEMFADEDFSE